MRATRLTSHSSQKREGWGTRDFGVGEGWATRPTFQNRDMGYRFCGGCQMWAVHPPRSLRCRVYPRTPSTVRPLADSKNEGGSGTEEGVAGEYPSKLPSDASRATPE